ncbi:unnamed protein product [Allacma fusca]|uniref:Uncharacterized protein n=1 Tax=Allacma fusca TaxID=39272 RepID=A0A8J2PLQ5_9HEXA|nr:unnamed protein product [Allacma fusca]
MLKFVLFSFVVFMLHEQSGAQFSFQNAWRQSVQKLESITLPPIRIGNFDLIPASQKKTDEENQVPVSDYEDLFDMQEVTTPGPEPIVEEPIEKVDVHQAFDSKPSQIQQTAEISKDDQTLIDFVVQKLTSIDSKVDKLQEELRDARETIQKQNQILEQCPCQQGSVTQVPPEEDLSIYARIATTPAPLDDVEWTSTPSQHSAYQLVGQSRQRIQQDVTSTPSQPSAFQYAGQSRQRIEEDLQEDFQEDLDVTSAPIQPTTSQIIGQSRQRVQYPTQVPYPQLYLSQATRVASTAAPVHTEDHDSQWFREHSIVQVSANRYPHNFGHIGQQYTDSSEELQDIRAHVVQ